MREDHTIPSECKTGTPWLDTRDRILAATLFVLALTVYLCTLCPSLYWGDCGELASAAYTLGIAHPTGYPVWCLAAKTWSLIFPFGTFIWRLNVLSAIFGAGAVTVLFLAARGLGTPKSVAWTCAGLFAFSRTFWQQCLFAETYSLTALYTCLLLYLALRRRANALTDRDLYLLSLTYGLAMTNHQTNTLFLPGFALFVFWRRRDLLRGNAAASTRVRLNCLVRLCAPLLAYAYLPLRAAAHPAANWGDPETAYALYYHVTGRLYAPLMFTAGTHFAVNQLRAWIAALSGEYSWPIVAIAALGLINLLRKANTRPAGALLTWILVTDVVYTINYDIYNRYIYFIPAYAVIALCFAAGLNDLWPACVRLLPESRVPAYTAACSLAVCALSPLQAGGHWHKNDLSNNWACYDYARNLLATVPAGGVLVDNGTDTVKTTVQYLQIVEGYRTDVLLVSRGMLANVYDFHHSRWANLWYFRQLAQKDRMVAQLYPGERFAPVAAWNEEPFKRLVDRCAHAGRPLYIVRPTQYPQIPDWDNRPIPLADYLDKHYSVARIGLMVRIYARGASPPDDALLAETRRVWSRYSLRGVYEGLYARDGFLTPLAIDYADGELGHGRLAFKLGSFEEAEGCYRRVLCLFESSEATKGVTLCEDAINRRVRPTGRIEASLAPHRMHTKKIPQFGG